ncbi:MAG TPA: carbamoyltransferase HypF [Candidatus Onthomonas avicola]|nr:carbamoyltransferase HypF [Candidatus Onthomonas avicola]
MADRRRVRLEVEGIVQGVGFRPFLHRLAARLHLGGWCRNTTAGVTLELEGDAEDLAAFRAALRREAPPLAVIERVRETPCPSPLGERAFRILESERVPGRAALVSPDIATCPDCLRELRDRRDRRYRYPFLNCTNCGPRFTILRRLPYDRENTSMAPWAMCPDCRREYGNISDRRYHAQPDCCPVCGPRLSFLDGAGRPVEGDPVARAAERIAAGGIVAVKGLGGYHLACLPDRPEIVAELRRRKRRDERPLAVLCRDVAAARRWCHISEEEAARLTSPRAPIVLLEKRTGLPDTLSETRELGILLPYTPVHHLLMDHFDALVLTSANLSDAPVLCDDAEALETFRHALPVEGILTHPREIVNRCDDSLLRVFRGRDYFFRRSRGYAPQPVELPEAADGVLACGAEQKASFCLTRGREAFLSAHIGDLKNLAVLEHYRAQIARFQDRFGIAATRLACDLHPDYLSTDYARARSRAEGLPLVMVQHHHAHMAACMADNRLTGPCIGLVWDGTGYGSDGTTWGAECLTGDCEGAVRRASMRPIALPGGDRCMQEIGRVAHSLLWDLGCPERSDCPNGARLTQMLGAGLNCPPSSGMGRLLDGVYALLTGRQTVSYEGQGAVLLEAMAGRDESAFPVSFYEERGLARLDTRPILAALLEELDKGVPAETLAARFLNTLVLAAVGQCRAAREQTGLRHVVLSGGVFQNRYLLPRVMDALEEAGFVPHCHSRVAANDEGLALGQTMIAAKGGGIPCAWPYP